MGVGLSRVTRSQMETVAGEYGYSKIEDLQAALGWGKFSARQVIAKLAPESVPPEPPPALPPTTQQAEQNAQWQDPGKDYVIQVKGINDLLLTRQVLQPIRGEPSSAISRGKASPYIPNCSNVQNLCMSGAAHRSRVGAGAGENFNVRLVVDTDDRTGILAQLTQILYDEEISIRSVEARADDDRFDAAVVEMTIEVRDKKQLERVVSTMRRVPGVRDIERKH